jgi:hypothetical protein
MLLFGCSEDVGRWRGGLPSGAQLGGNGGRVLRWLELKPKERRMDGGGSDESHHVAGERTGGGGWGARGSGLRQDPGAAETGRAAHGRCLDRVGGAYDAWAPAQCQ